MPWHFQLIIYLLLSSRNVFALVNSPLSSSAASLNDAPLPFPTTCSMVVQQASKAIGLAFRDGMINRQTIRVPLSESMYSDKEEGFVADRAIGWQGGPQETYRYLLPLASDVLRMTAQKIVDDNTGGLVARIQEQSLLDFDGSALLTAENPAGPLHDVQALLQPNTDSYYIKTIQQVEKLFSDTPKKPQRLFVLVNPSWRNQQSFGYFGAARKAQSLILDRYPITYAVDQFVVRGQRIGLLKAYPHDWQLYCSTMPYNNNQASEPQQQFEQPELLGTFPKRPEYNVIDKLVCEKIATIRS